MHPDQVVAPGNASTPRRWTKLVTAIATIVGVISGAIAIYEFVNRDKGPAVFTGAVDTAAGMRGFLDFADEHDGQLVKLDLKCVYHDDQPMACVQQADPLEQAVTVLDLNDDPSCEPDRESACDGSVILYFFADRVADAQIDNGEFGAGSIVVRGYFNLAKRGNLGILPPSVTAIYLTAVPANEVGVTG
ncbi:hypothetical protein [Rhizocola hellebori]|uniref:hypothetical protein n=1 Tax=Rhizocola hellebori TaxID=1392758 RepID=UPI0019459E31|nr:hypothetical protein [Rhizocola hellebori]